MKENESSIYKSAPFYSLLLSVIIIAYTVFKGGIWTGHDISAHIDRALAINGEISNLQVFSGFDFFNSNRFGYAWGIFYPPASALIMSLSKIMTLGLAGVIFQIKLTVFIIIIASVATSYYLGFYVYRDKEKGLWCSFFYINSVYFMSNVFLRFSLGEVAAACFIPMLILGLNASIDKRKERAILPIAISLVSLSNIPLLLCSIVVCSITVIIRLRDLDIKSISWIASSLIISAILCLFYFLPMAYEISSNSIWASGNINFDFDKMWSASSDLSTLILGDEHVIDQTPVGAFRTIGLINVVLFLYSFFKSRSDNVLGYGFLAIFSLLMSTKFFPWYAIPTPLSFLTYIQFPWRFLLYSSILCALVSSGAIEELNKRNYILITLILIVCMTTIHATKPARNLRIHDIKGVSSLYKDYLPSTANQEYIVKRNEGIINSSDGSEIKTDKFYKFGYPVFKFESEGGYVELPVLYYNLFQVDVNGVIVNKINSHGFIKIKSDKGYNIVHVKPDLIITSSYSISLLAFLMYIIIYYKRNRK